MSSFHSCCHSKPEPELTLPLFNKASWPHVWKENTRLFVQKLLRMSRPQQSITLGSWSSGDSDWLGVDGARHRLTLGQSFPVPSDSHVSHRADTTGSHNLRSRNIKSAKSYFDRWPLIIPGAMAAILLLVITLPGRQCVLMFQFLISPDQPKLAHFRESGSWFIKPGKAMHASPVQPIPALGKLRQGDYWKLQVIRADLVSLCIKTKQNYPQKSPV